MLAKFPFLKNFPFEEFEIEVGEMAHPGMAQVAHGSEPAEFSSPTIIKFNINDKVKGRLAISIFEQELEWVAGLAGQITVLDSIRKTLDKGIKSKDIIVKRNAVDEAEEWCKNLQNDRARLSYSTLGDALMRMVDNHGELTSVISKIVALSSRSGLVSLSKAEHDIILAHYHFQLIYTKLILGLIISAKISI